MKPNTDIEKVKDAWRKFASSLDLADLPDDELSDQSNCLYESSASFREWYHNAAELRSMHELFKKCKYWP